MPIFVTLMTYKRIHRGVERCCSLFGMLCALSDLTVASHLESLAIMISAVYATCSYANFCHCDD